MSQRRSKLYRGRHSVTLYYFSVICKDPKDSTYDWIGPEEMGNPEKLKEIKTSICVCVGGPQYTEVISFV